LIPWQHGWPSCKTRKLTKDASGERAYALSKINPRPQTSAYNPVNLLIAKSEGLNGCGRVKTRRGRVQRGGSSSVCGKGVLPGRDGVIDAGISLVPTPPEAANLLLSSRPVSCQHLWVRWIKEGAYHVLKIPAFRLWNTTHATHFRLAVLVGLAIGAAQRASSDACEKMSSSPSSSMARLSRLAAIVEGDMGVAEPVYSVNKVNGPI
jgi:hypothetical protein